MNKDLQFPKICIIGAGFSGINAGIQIQKQLNLNSFTIFEEQSDIGGTWLANSYPGIACDVQSHLYSLSYEQNPEWSSNYSSGEEILEYMKKVARKYNIYKHTKFNTKITRAEWIEEEQNWKLDVLDTNSNLVETLTFDIVISGIGGLRVPQIPEKFLSFQGPILHSAEWNHKICLKNKRVAVIGSGASAIQIVPAIAPEVAELHSYVRKPGWILPKFDFNVPNWLKYLFATIPLLLLLYRYWIYWMHELIFKAFKVDTFLNSLAQKVAKSHLKKSLKGHQDLQRDLTPNYRFGCKRIMVSNDYYPTFKKLNVHLHRSDIEEVRGNKIYLKDGTWQEIDVLVLATGFKVQDYFAPLELIGKNRISVLPKWYDEGPQTYFGIMSHLNPNLFHILGPNGIAGYTSALVSIECHTNFIMKLIKQMMKKNAKVVAVKENAVADWMESIQADLKATVWAIGDCGSYFVDSKGRVTTVWPKSATAYYNATKKINFDHFEFH